ncbi:hypothetical protein E4U22_004303 [Claviceps purpurea]|nr:hypothetical protein E4U22_004303 [Claviceps purpurea]
MASMGLPCYHKIMSILETGSVLKTTDFDVHWFVDRQHFINPPALRLREPAVVRKAWKPVARRPNAKASSTARGSTRNELSDRNDVGAARPVGQPSDQGPIPGPSQAAVRALARDRVSCSCKSQTACNTNNCSCRRANVLCGRWCHKGDTRCGNLTDAKLEAAQKEEYARQQGEKLLLVEQQLQQLTGVLHQSQIESAERAERAARELRHVQEQQSLRFWPPHPEQYPHFAQQPLQPPPTTQQQQQHLQLGPADFIPAPNHTRIRQRTGQHPLGWQ